MIVILHRIVKNSFSNEVEWRSKAIDFLSKVKLHFKNYPDEYKNFLKLMKQYKFGQINTSELVSQIFESLQDAGVLFEEFKTFLPERA